MSAWSFRDLDLGGVEPERGSSSLKPGRYVCKVTDVEIKDTRTEKGSGKRLVVTLTDMGGQGRVIDGINIAHTNPMTADIGRRRLKALLQFGGHRSPDHPGDISSLKGLVVGVNVEQGEDWTNDKGEARKGGGRPRENGAYFDPAELPGGDAPPAYHGAGSVGADLNDRIPF